MKRIVLIQVVTALILAAAITAEVPQMINYQGGITDSDGEALSDTTLNITFSIYSDTTGGTALWSSGAQSLQVTNGSFDYQLGSNVALYDHIFPGTAPCYLGINVDGDSVDGTGRLSVGSHSI